MLRQAAIICLAFFVYSFIGWSYESTIWAKAEKKKFMNRGYLMGCYCPIYGFVSLLDWFVLCRIPNPVAIFIVAAVVCCCLEYATSWVLEKLFHQRWWDYSNYPLNLNGRISLLSALFFGAAGLLLVRLVHPLTIRMISLLPDQWMYVSAGTISAVFVADCIITTVSLKHGSKHVEWIYNQITYRTAMPFDYLNVAVVPIDEAAKKNLHKAKIQMRKTQRQMKSMQKKAALSAKRTARKARLAAARAAKKAAKLLKTDQYIQNDSKLEKKE